MLFFRNGQRPNASTIREAIGKLPAVDISHDPAASDDESAAADKSWLELLAQGMTFDLQHLEPGASAHVPQFEHYFDCQGNILDSGIEAAMLVPGPHLSGGERTLPVVRVMAGVVASLSTKLPSLLAVGWPPAGAIISPGFFRTTVEAWNSGGPFPALGLTSFKQSESGNLESVGLSYFTGQELQLDADFVADRAQATQLAIRLVNQLVQHGTLHDAEAIMAPDGTQLRLEPISDGHVIRVWRG